jgi:hypothetical protein
MLKLNGYFNSSEEFENQMTDLRSTLEADPIATSADIKSERHSLGYSSPMYAAHSILNSTAVAIPNNDIDSNVLQPVYNLKNSNKIKTKHRKTKNGNANNEKLSSRRLNDEENEPWSDKLNANRQEADFNYDLDADNDCNSDTLDDQFGNSYAYNQSVHRSVSAYTFNELACNFNYSSSQPQQQQRHNQQTIPSSGYLANPLLNCKLSEDMILKSLINRNISHLTDQICKTTNNASVNNNNENNNKKPITNFSSKLSTFQECPMLKENNGKINSQIANEQTSDLSSNNTILNSSNLTNSSSMPNAQQYYSLLFANSALKAAYINYFISSLTSNEQTAQMVANNQSNNNQRREMNTDCAINFTTMPTHLRQFSSSYSLNESISKETNKTKSVANLKSFLESASEAGKFISGSGSDVFNNKMDIKKEQSTSDELPKLTERMANSNIFTSPIIESSISSLLLNQLRRANAANSNILNPLVQHQLEQQLLMQQQPLHLLQQQQQQQQSIQHNIMQSKLTQSNSKTKVNFSNVSDLIN